MIEELFNDRYRILRVLGQGGMSKVYLAENIKLGSLWAIKQVDRLQYSQKGFSAEPDILKKLSHPALPRIFDIAEDEEFIYMVVDYIEGKTLEQRLMEDGAFSEALVVGWAKQLCAVLGYLHSQKPNPIIYRDMKPSNIILTANGQIKLIDFGIAREFKSNTGTDTIYIGTRGYAAPEQYGSGQTSAATDIYSLGITLYHLLTGISPGEPPYEILPLRKIDSDFSEEIENIVIKCTKQNPDERYQSTSEILEDLEYNLCEGIGDLNRERNIKKEAASFRRQVITVWDNAEFGCELAYVAAKTSGMEILLIDIDLLAPKADIFLNIKRQLPKLPGDCPSSGTGVQLAAQAIEKNYFTGELLYQLTINRKEMKHLHILTGSYRLLDYEYFRDSTLFKLIDTAMTKFDLTILLVNRSIYDSYTVCSLMKADINLAAVRPDLDKIREFNCYIAFLKDKQNIPVEKTRFVAFEYNKATCITRSELIEATGGRFAGLVSYSSKRAIYRNLKGTYAIRMESHIHAEYVEILSILKIVVKPRLVSKIKNLVNGIFLSSIERKKVSKYQGVEICR